MLHHFPGELTLVHSYGLGSLAYSELAVSAPQLFEEVRENEAKRLEHYAETHFREVQCEQIVRPEDIGYLVQNAIKHRGCDLVMLPTRGNGVLRRMLLGSVTAKILHDSDCAVWTATEAALEAPGNLPYRSVLCAVDGGEESEAAVRAAVRMAAAYRACLTILHVVEMMDTAVDVDPELLRRSLVDTANFELRELTGRLNLDVPHRVIEGPVASTIRDEAVRANADLIVAGRGRIHGTLSRMWSHLYSIVRDATCPVLSV
jgi:nucleotide-binding universal stress UspA family protein